LREALTCPACVPSATESAQREHARAIALLCELTLREFSPVLLQQRERATGRRILERSLGRRDQARLLQ
jgi:hypothetical protein